MDAFIETTLGLTEQPVEVVEPKPAHVNAFSGPVVSITVTDVAATYARLNTHGADIRSDIINNGDGLGWFYFGVPGSTIFQISGAYVS